jgi:hypothetical protein
MYALCCVAVHVTSASGHTVVPTGSMLCTVGYGGVHSIFWEWTTH